MDTSIAPPGMWTMMSGSQSPSFRATAADAQLLRVPRAVPPGSDQAKLLTCHRDHPKSSRSEGQHFHTPNCPYKTLVIPSGHNSQPHRSLRSRAP
jgi:hypothetical protein